jgi:hypothetical protein
MPFLGHQDIKDICQDRQYIELNARFCQVLIVAEVYQLYMKHSAIFQKSSPLKCAKTIFAFASLLPSQLSDLLGKG